MISKKRRAPRRAEEHGSPCDVNVRQRRRGRWRLDLDEHVFGIEPNGAVVHQAVVRQLANASAGHRTTPRRAARSRGGTQEAVAPEGHRPRAPGLAAAPHWRVAAWSSGRTRARTTRTLPKKMRRLARALGALGQGGSPDELIVVIEELTVEAPSTKAPAGHARLGAVSPGAIAADACSEPAGSAACSSRRGTCVNVRRPSPRIMR